MMFRSVLAGSAICSVLFTGSAYAFAGTDPNAIREMNQVNFRRPIGNARYRYSQRRIQASDTGVTGTGNTFNSRADYLREAKLKLIQDELQDREFSGIRRDSKTYYERPSRAVDTAQRRINEAQRRGGIRLRRGTATLQQLGDLDREEKQQRIEEYRAEVQAAETDRYNFATTDCEELLGRRRARCLYERRAD